MSQRVERNLARLAGAPAVLRFGGAIIAWFIPSVTYATSAQWDLDPISGDWNTAANWTPLGVPNGPADTATFGLSNTTDVSISANTEVNGITFTPVATNPYTITASPGLTLTISGIGITNNSGITQNFATVAGGEIRFINNATGGSNVSISNEGGTTNFFNHSSAVGASIFNEAGGTTNFFDHSTGEATNETGGTTNFFDHSTGGATNETGGTTNFFDHSTGGGSILNSFEGSTNFFDHSNAGTAFILHEDFGTTNFFNRSSAGNADIETFNTGAAGAFMTFNDNSTAGSAFIGVTDTSRLQFYGNSTADNATIAGAGFVSFFESSTAGSATIISSGVLSFENSSRGGRAQIELRSDPPINYFGELDIDHDITIGSLEGDEFTGVALGGNLTVGSNNLSTTFSGVIVGQGGSLTKIGSGTFILSGASTYTGDTNVNGGALQVDGSINSNTTVHGRGTLAGTGTINGNVINTGTVRPGGALGTPGVLTVAGNYTQAQYATLMIQIAGASAGDFSVLNVLGNANLNGYLDPVLLNGFVPTIGQTFTFLDYASLTGGFSRILHPVFNNGTEQWSVIYQNNNAILTVEAFVPDKGSTFLLLMLGLLGLVTYRRQLLRGQP